MAGAVAHVPRVGLLGGFVAGAVALLGLEIAGLMFHSPELWLLALPSAAAVGFVPVLFLGRRGCVVSVGVLGVQAAVGVVFLVVGEFACAGIGGCGEQDLGRFAVLFMSEFAVAAGFVGALAAAVLRPAIRRLLAVGDSLGVEDPVLPRGKRRRGSRTARRPDGDGPQAER